VIHVLAVPLLAALVLALPLPQAAPPVCARCGWKPPGGPVTRVKNVADLERAVGEARPGDTILIADGTYALRRTIDVRSPRVTLRGRAGDATGVVIRGGGMTGDSVGVGISVSAADVTIADLTLRDFGNHAIQVRGELSASRFTLHNARLLDTGQQLLKGSVAKGPAFADEGLVACSEFSYTTSAPSDYTNAIDLLATSRWVIRDNRLSNIRGPEKGGWQSGPAILVWAASDGTIVERNLIVDSYRGIALGLTNEPMPYARNGEAAYDHAGGVIRNNVVVNLNRWADEAIEANAARDVRIEHNTVFTEGATPWSIQVRFSGSHGLIRNNLTNHRIFLRDGGRATLDGNVMSSRRNWFVDPLRADMHLAPAGRPAIDAGVAIEGPDADFDRAVRPAGRAPDAGAFESAAGTSAGLPFRKPSR
jgi:Right handed beta helix region